MKRRSVFWRRRWVLPWHQRRVLHTQRFPSLGFTLVELLVTSILLSVVTLLAWTGLLAVMDMSNAAQAKTARQMELNQALDFMTNEIRMAEHINEVGGVKANGTTISLQNVIQSSGIKLANLGSYGTLALYLERPTRTDRLKADGTCPAGGPNAGQKPPPPEDYDPVVYDIRPSPSGWLPPGTLMRYGRVPDADGSVNPCRSPIASDAIADSLSLARQVAPTCSGDLFGAGGFQTCVQGNQVDLFFQSAIADVGTKDISTAVSSRMVNFDSMAGMAASSDPLTLEVAPTPGKSDHVTLTWTWSGAGSVSEYSLSKIEDNGTEVPLYTGTQTTFESPSTGEVSFKVSAKIGTSTVESKPVTVP